MTKYIRTENGRILEWEKLNEITKLSIDTCEETIKEADTIEELCDTFVIVKGTENKSYMIEEIYEVACNEVEFAIDNYIEVYLYGAIWTDKGLMYVAKMNDKGELKLV